MLCCAIVLMFGITGCVNKGNPKEQLFGVMSYNMKFESSTGGGDPIHTWENRKPGIVKSLADYSVQIVGTQELQRWQYRELLEALGNKWAGVGEARNLPTDENNAILYRADLLEYVEGETIWLSSTPEVRGSKSWDTAHPRILTYGKFKEKSSNFEFYFFNTHLDHKSAQAREKGLELIVSYMMKYQEYPMFLTGDFNMFMEAQEFKALQEQKELFQNSFEPFFEKFEVNGKTSHGFNGGTEGKAIDFIIYSKTNWELVNTDIIYDRFEERYYLSDHYPVFSQFRKKETK